MFVAVWALAACDPTPESARSDLAALTVAVPPANLPAYSRDAWPHWRDPDGNGCDAREDVLKAESVIPAQVNPQTCAVISGGWVSVYDGVTTTNASSFDIDHMVPLANAHRSGGWNWTTAQRQAFANDITNKQTLVAVTASSNRSKGDKSPDQWKPPLASAWCNYAIDWVTVKKTWSLTVTPTEKTTLTQMLATCPT